MITIKKYNSNSFVARPKVTVYYNSHAEELKKLGGIYEPNLFSDKERKPGWIFRERDIGKLEEYIEKMNMEIKHKHKQITPYLFDDKCGGDKIIRRGDNLQYWLVPVMILYSAIITTAFFTLLTTTTGTSIIPTDFYNFSYNWRRIPLNTYTHNFHYLLGHFHTNLVRFLDFIC